MTRLPTTTTNDDSLRNSIFASGGIHFLVLLFVIFGLPHFLKPLPTPYIPIPIDIVDVSDITNTRIKEQQEPPKPPEPPKPEAQKTVQQFQPPTPPTPPQPEQKPQPQEQAQAEALLPKPSEKPTPPKPAAKPQSDLLASVLKNVQKMKPAEKAPPDTKTPAKSQAQAQPKSMAPSLSDRLTVSEEDALRRQIEQCWNPPIGAREAQNLVVEVAIIVNPDRTVQNAEVVDKSRMNGDPYFRAAGEAAIRAIFNPRCSPLELPADKYEQWKNIDFTFDPRDML